ncbi:MAG: polynucleotide adenylyltransferase PcnB [Burkholderiaceae bacterium]|nr:polynucleotide adenylyltransferase PcnB [Burkholderiaceae bacterium]
MIRKLIGRLLGRKTRPAPLANAEPRSYQGTAEGVRREELPKSATRTCEALQQAGFKAFIVGGGVRDLLLGLKPKDFDVATDATPEEVRKIFRRSRIIGRRFQIVHVLFGRETIEVSTFRALQADAETDEHGRVLRDNVWGSQAEDATRRDFTINALYYDPVADLILDYHDGVRDLHRRTLRMIGDPATRYREDPIRMLRTARFAAKTGFTIEPATSAPIRELAPLIHNVPSARVFDEMLKLLQSGHALDSLHQLRSEGLHHGLLPLLDVILEQPDGARFVHTALANTDQRVAEGKSISPGFLFATLLWQQVRVRWDARVAAGENSIPALHSAIDSALDEQGEKLSIQKRIVGDMREIWVMQPRFEKRSPGAANRLVAHLRFRAAYDFMILRCDAGDAPAELGAWWTRFIDAGSDAREELLAQAPAGAVKRKRRRRGARKPSGKAQTEGADTQAAPNDAE